MTRTQKRLQNELKLLKKSPLDLIDFFPDEKDIFTWYFLVKGPEKTDYIGGHYIGKIMISHGYPNTPIDFMMLTPNGRFEIDKKICLTNSGYHSNEWSPAWNMSTIMLGFLSIMADDTTNGLAHIKRTAPERKILANESFQYNQKKYSHLMTNFKRFVSTDDYANIRMYTDEEIKIMAESLKKTKKDKKIIVGTKSVESSIIPEKAITNVMPEKIIVETNVVPEKIIDVAIVVPEKIIDTANVVPEKIEAKTKYEIDSVNINKYKKSKTSAKNISDRYNNILGKTKK